MSNIWIKRIRTVFSCWAKTCALINFSLACKQYSWKNKKKRTKTDVKLQKSPSFSFIITPTSGLLAFLFIVTTDGSQSGKGCVEEEEAAAEPKVKHCFATSDDVSPTQSNTQVLVQMKETTSPPSGWSTVYLSHPSPILVMSLFAHFLKNVADMTCALMF